MYISTQTFHEDNVYQNFNPLPFGWGWSGWPSPPRQSSRYPPSTHAVHRCTPQHRGVERSAAEREQRLGKTNTPFQSHNYESAEYKRAHRRPSSSHLSQRGFALEEVSVLAALWRVEFGVEESAAVGYGLQGGRTLVWERQTHKQLQRRKKQID